MAWGFLIVGAILLIAAWKKKQGELWALLKDDFSGEGNFFVWIIAIIFLVAIGNVRAVRPVADAFLGLVILVIILAPYRNGQDLFQQFMSEVKKGTS